MPRWSLTAAVLVALHLAAPAAAQTTAPPPREDVMAIAADKNIKMKLDKLIAAINASTFDWSVADVYQLVDMGHPPEVIKPAAAKAGMFFNDPKPMSAIIAAGRATAQPEVIPINSNDDFVIVFETFNDIKYAMDEANKARESIPPRATHESDDDWFLRQRRAEEVRVAAVAPLEGRINQMTFDAQLTGEVVAEGGCNKPKVSIPLDRIDFNLFRYTLGGKQVDLVTGITGKNVEKVAFLGAGARRFEAVGTCGTAAPGTPVKLSVRLHRAHDSDAWTGTAEFK